MQEQQQQLKDFKFKKLLLNSPETQTIVLLGYFEDENKEAVLIFKKKPFSDDYQNNLNKIIQQNKYFENDIFTRYNIEIQNDEWNEIDLQTIYPATQKLINKYTKCDSIIVVETPEIYNSVVKKYIDEVKTNSLQWLYNILEGKAEQERILYQNQDMHKGFIILPDYKFNDFTNTQQLYLLAITQRRDIQSLRDLDGSHIELLENIQRITEQTIQEKFKIFKNKIRAYIHYHPTYYHLHIHFTHIEVQETSMNCDRSHPLHQVIYNLKKDPSYYKNTPLMYSIQSTNPLYSQLKQITEQN
ncbi:hypothetical protein ABPG74_004639 [Tetrahymena malaccensis]